MTKFKVLALAGCFILLWGIGIQAATMSGDYVETRNADVYTGYCVANSEVGLVGNQAIMAWHVKEGTWKGVRLDGLSVVGITKASASKRYVRAMLRLQVVLDGIPGLSKPNRKAVRD